VVEVVVLTAKVTKVVPILVVVVVVDGITDQEMVAVVVLG
jgi:hypothetical protein